MVMCGGCVVCHAVVTMLCRESVVCRVRMVMLDGGCAIHRRVVPLLCGESMVC